MILIKSKLKNKNFIIKGYVGDLTFLNKLADIVEELKKQNENLVYCMYFCLTMLSPLIYVKHNFV